MILLALKVSMVFNLIINSRFQLKVDPSKLLINPPFLLILDIKGELMQ